MRSIKKTPLLALGLFLLMLGVLLFASGIGDYRKLISTPCSYDNDRPLGYGTCQCLGLKVDTSCGGLGYVCLDAGSSSGCIGLVRDKKCFKADYSRPIDYKEVSCRR